MDFWALREGLLLLVGRWELYSVKLPFSVLLLSHRNLRRAQCCLRCWRRTWCGRRCIKHFCHLLRVVDWLPLLRKWRAFGKARSCLRNPCEYLPDGTETLLLSPCLHNIWGCLLWMLNRSLHNIFPAVSELVNFLNGFLTGVVPFLREVAHIPLLFSVCYPNFLGFSEDSFLYHFLHNYIPLF